MVTKTHRWQIIQKEPKIAQPGAGCSLVRLKAGMYSCLNIVLCKNMNQLNSQGPWNNSKEYHRVNMTELSWIIKKKNKQTTDHLLRKVAMLDLFYKTEERSRKIDWNWTFLSSITGIITIFQRTVFLVSWHNSMSTVKSLFLELFLCQWKIKPVSVTKKISS